MAQGIVYSVNRKGTADLLTTLHLNSHYGMRSTYCNIITIIPIAMELFKIPLYSTVEEYPV